MIHFLIEILSHASFFLIFLTIFYMTYVGFIQEHSMVTEFSSLLTQSVQTMGIVLPPQVLQFISALLNAAPQVFQPALDAVVQEEDGSNKQLLSPVFTGVAIAAGCGLVISFALAFMTGYSIPLLFAENLIALSIIAITDILITTIYGNFRTLDSQYLMGIFAQRASGLPVQCDVVKDTLDKMFPIPFVQNLINKML